MPQLHGYPEEDAQDLSCLDPEKYYEIDARTAPEITVHSDCPKCGEQGTLTEEVEEHTNATGTPVLFCLACEETVAAKNKVIPL